MLPSPRPGHYWKTPFVWEPGCAAPHPDNALTFEKAPDDWLGDAIGQVMSHSLDESDQDAVSERDAAHAAADLLALASHHFVVHEGWWRRARNHAGEIAGFVLPARFTGDESAKDTGREGTIFYMGVLPAHRGHGHAARLVMEATRILIGAGCRRILCDTGSTNLPMINAFRRAGYIEREPWQRPLH